MRKSLFLGAILGTALVALAAKDPVLMKINGKDIKLSEFEYLYQKNNKQQIEKETLEKYVDRFVTYKLKVAEAEEMRLDTIKAFVNEYNGYKRDLSMPYLEEYCNSIFLTALNIFDTLTFTIDITFGLITILVKSLELVKVPLEFSNLPTQIPFNSVEPNVNAGWVSHSPSLVPVDLAVFLSSKTIFIACSTLEELSTFHN